MFSFSLIAGLQEQQFHIIIHCFQDFVNLIHFANLSLHNHFVLKLENPGLCSQHDLLCPLGHYNCHIPTFLNSVSFLRCKNQKYTLNSRYEFIIFSYCNKKMFSLLKILLDDCKHFVDSYPLNQWFQEPVSDDCKISFWSCSSEFSTATF